MEDIEEINLSKNNITDIRVLENCKLSKLKKLCLNRNNIKRIESK